MMLYQRTTDQWVKGEQNRFEGSETRHKQISLGTPTRRILKVNP